MPFWVPMNRLPFRVSSGGTLRVPRPAFPCSPRGRCQSDSKPWRSLACCGSGELQKSPPLSVPGAPWPRASVSGRLRSWSRNCWGTGPACLGVDPSTSQKDLQGDGEGEREGEQGSLCGDHTHPAPRVHHVGQGDLAPPTFFALLSFLFK